jgi:hypothetical protein
MGLVSSSEGPILTGRSCLIPTRPHLTLFAPCGDDLLAGTTET